MIIRLIHHTKLGWGVIVIQGIREAITFCEDRAAAVELKRQAEQNAAVAEFLLGNSDTLPEGYHAGKRQSGRAGEAAADAA